MRRALIAAALAAPVVAAAQWGGSVSVASDERARGVSTTGDEPTLRATLAWDQAGGAFGGVSLAGSEYRPGPQRLKVHGFAGITRPLGAAMRWEAGVSLQRLEGDARFNFDEVFAGLGGDAWTLRLNLSDSYLGSGIGTVYAEVDAQQALADRWRLLAHVGALVRRDGRDGPRWDARVGVALHAGEVDWQLAWSVVQRGGAFALPARLHRQRLVAGASWAF